jgi:hypothetical protein
MFSDQACKKLPAHGSFLLEGAFFRDLGSFFIVIHSYSVTPIGFDFSQILSGSQNQRIDIRGFLGTLES